MPLKTGSKVGAYEIIAPLGAGGMGEVYRARDTKLNRDVALKVLPQEFPRDSERMARFEREAQLLASLNHPNIASIYGFEKGTEHFSPGHGETDLGQPAKSALSPFLVMEMVEGSTLAERIAQGAIAIEEALQIARQIAEGLEAAHSNGIIHRDLKPANIKITPAGSVKLLDFGLAKALEADAARPDKSMSPTLTVAATQAGIILGTAGYMSPEQAKGKTTDRRADIWAFGVVMFEMLAGKSIFTGETVSETLASVIKEEPHWTELPKDTPPAILRLLRRCLAKDPKARLRDIGDARLELEECASSPEMLRDAEPLPSRISWAAVAGITLASAAITAAIFLLFRPPVQDLPLRKLVIQTTGKLDNDNRPFLISPDGSRVVYVEAKKLWVRKLDETQARELVGTGPLIRDSDGVCPFWSPDGKFVVYGSAGKLWKISADGGPAATLCNLPGNYHGGAWGDSDTIVFATTRGPMYKVP